MTAPTGGAGIGVQLRAGLRVISAGNRRRWMAVALLSMGASVFELVGGVLVVGLLGSTTTGRVSMPLVGDLSERFPSVEQDTLLATTAALTALFFLVRGTYMVVEAFVRSRIAQNAGAVLAKRMLEGYLAMPYVQHASRNSAELIRNTTDSVSTVLTYVIVPGVAVASELSVVLALFVLLGVRAPLPTLAAIVVFAPVLVVLLKLVQPRLSRLGHESQREMATSIKAVQQALHGHRDVTLLGRRDAFAGAFSASRFSFARIKYLHATLTEMPRIAIETVATVFVLGFLAVSAQRGTTAKESFEVLGLFAYASFRIMPSVNRIVAAVNNLRYGGAAALDLAHDLEEAELYRARAHRDEAAPLPYVDAIRFEEVTFRYPGRDTDAVSEVDLVIPRGESVGFVGASGGGKSTLIDLAVGLLQPTSGRVTVDGVEIADQWPSWQARLGVVSQVVYLLDDTIRANVAFGVPGEEVDEDALTEAVELAQLDDVIRASPAGLETLLGERGVRLSGGQRQRIAIARALYRRPDVLVFDEGTSALDHVTEAAIVDAMERLRGDRTILTVAHRISTVRGCDRIHVVEGGRIVASGSHDELLVHSTAFQSLLGTDRAQ